MASENYFPIKAMRSLAKVLKNENRINFFITLKSNQKFSAVEDLFKEKSTYS